MSYISIAGTVGWVLYYRYRNSSFSRNYRDGITFHRKQCKFPDIIIAVSLLLFKVMKETPGSAGSLAENTYHLGLNKWIVSWDAGSYTKNVCYNFSLQTL